MSLYLKAAMTVYHHLRRGIHLFPKFRPPQSSLYGPPLQFPYSYDHVYIWMHVWLKCVVMLQILINFPSRLRQARVTNR